MSTFFEIGMLVKGSRFALKVRKSLCLSAELSDLRVTNQLFTSTLVGNLLLIPVLAARLGELGLIFRGLAVQCVLSPLECSKKGWQNR
jgi:hypothetical protein